MRCFKWKKFRRKGKKKLQSMDERSLKKNISDLRIENLKVKSIKDISREILLTEE